MLFKHGLANAWGRAASVGVEVANCRIHIAAVVLHPVHPELKYKGIEVRRRLLMHLLGEDLGPCSRDADQLRTVPRLPLFLASYSGSSCTR